MTSISKTFSATGYSATLDLGQSSPSGAPAASGAYTITGTFVATLILERTTTGGQTWDVIATYTGTQTVLPIYGPGTYRWNCSDYTSGSPVVTLATTEYVRSIVYGTGQQPVTITYNDSFSALGVSPAAVTNSATVAVTTTTLTSVLASPVGNLVLPANSIKAGRVIRVRMGGKLTTTVTNPAMSLSLYLNGVSMAAASFSVPTAATAKPWSAEIDMQVKAVGASVGYGVSGKSQVQVDSGSAFFVCGNWLDATTGLDTTVANTMDVKFQFEDAAQSFTVYTLSIEQINGN